jgi:hypothetical protein
MVLLGALKSKADICECEVKRHLVIEYLFDLFTGVSVESPKLVVWLAQSLKLLDGQLHAP